MYFDRVTSKFVFDMRNADSYARKPYTSTIYYGVNSDCLSAAYLTPRPKFCRIIQQTVLDQLGLVIQVEATANITIRGQINSDEYSGFS